jgi:hypothetical protein
LVQTTWTLGQHTKTFQPSKNITYDIQSGEGASGARGNGDWDSRQNPLDQRGLSSETVCLMHRRMDALLLRCSATQLLVALSAISRLTNPGYMAGRAAHSWTLATSGEDLFLVFFLVFLVGLGSYWRLFQQLKGGVVLMHSGPLEENLMQTLTYWWGGLDFLDKPFFFGWCIWDWLVTRAFCKCSLGEGAFHLTDGARWRLDSLGRALYIRDIVTSRDTSHTWSKRSPRRRRPVWPLGHVPCDYGS